MMASPILLARVYNNFNMTNQSAGIDFFDSNGTRIPKVVFLPTTIALFSFAVCAACFRTFARYRYYKKLSSSDYFLTAGCITLTGTFVYTLTQVDHMYSGFIIPDQKPLVSPQITRSMAVGQILSWVTIYTTKFGFMMFFRQLAKGIRAVERVWWAAAITIGVAYLATLGFSLFVSMRTLHSSYNSGFRFLSILQAVYMSVTITLDVATDLLVISIPVRLLWNLQTKTLTKLALMGIFSLSGVMIVISIIRGTFARLPTHPVNSGAEAGPGDGSDIPPPIDVIWLSFWQLAEASISIIMLSLTAIRAFLRDAKRRKKAAPIDADNAQHISDSESAKWDSEETQRQRIQVKNEATHDGISGLQIHENSGALDHQNAKVGGAEVEEGPKFTGDKDMTDSQNTATAQKSSRMTGATIKTFRQVRRPKREDHKRTGQGQSISSIPSFFGSGSRAQSPPPLSPTRRNSSTRPLIGCNGNPDAVDYSADEFSTVWAAPNAAKIRPAHSLPGRSRLAIEEPGFVQRVYH